ncbi:MAG: hypothetical protein MJZ34_02985 [Paludibacteraceae bacterium]|nr:hypothetical protein [Paludibacteraceae bacterium]
MNQIIIQPGAELVTQNDEVLSESAKKAFELFEKYNIQLTQKLLTKEDSQEDDTSVRLYEGSSVATAYRNTLRFSFLTVGHLTEKIGDRWYYRPLCESSSTYTDEDGCMHRLNLVVYNSLGSSPTDMCFSLSHFGILDVTNFGAQNKYDIQHVPENENLYYINYHMPPLQLTESGFGTYGKTKAWKNLLGC